MNLEFNFIGKAPASKSIFNRLLIVKSIYPEFKIFGSSQADDIQLMGHAVNQILEGQNKEYNCGHAGTALRFLALRLSKIQGVHKLVGSKRLFSRPQKELVQILSQLGCAVDIKEDEMTIESFGWKLAGDAIHVSGGRSSQFISAILLSAWELRHPLFITVNDEVVSKAYIDLTVKLLKRLGMNIEVSKDYREIHVPKEQKPTLLEYKVEMDVSSVFALSAMAAVSGKLVINDFPEFSLQPDVYFLEIFRQLCVNYQVENSRLIVTQTSNLNPIEVNINNCPDLFPCLAVLCLACSGESKITGISQLKHKESDRQKVISDFLEKLGAKVNSIEDGIEIIPPSEKLQKIIELDSDQDHRIVMAGALATYMGYNVHINKPEVVSKSFPEFMSFVNPVQGELH